MDCREFRILLGRLRNGEDDAAFGEGLERHAADCDTCRGLLEDRELAALSAHEAEALTAGIMARTSGSPCALARELIADPERDANSAELLEAHTGHCEECASLLAALAWADSLLPAMAELDPGPGFTEAVLADTSGSVAESSPGLLENLRERWRGMVARPRFSLEGAYVATLILVLFFGTPLSPAKDAPPRALEALKSGPGALAPHLRWLRGGISERGQVFWTSGGASVAQSASEFGEEVAARSRRASPALGELRGDMGALLGAILRLDLAEADTHVDEVGDDLARIWEGCFGELPPANGEEKTEPGSEN